MRNFRPLTSSGRCSLLLVGRELLHAVVPVGEAVQAPALHRFEQRLAVRSRWNWSTAVDVVEQEWQVEHLQLLGVAVELR